MTFTKKIKINHNGEKTIVISIDLLDKLNRTDSIIILRKINKIINFLNNKNVILEHSNLVSDYNLFYINTKIDGNNINFITNNINCFNINETIKYYLENELFNLNISNNIKVYSV